MGGIAMILHIVEGDDGMAERCVRACVQCSFDSEMVSTDAEDSWSLCANALLRFFCMLGALLGIV